ncbi:hypothetical protein HJC23_002981 [Cyclotella cryptica]|uniref:Peptidase M50 domain-containing protein n=1 Tax=Cyclotella cryptica TaxID=29204 RepID=A0ABD3P3E7_9STRA
MPSMTLVGALISALVLESFVAYGRSNRSALHASCNSFRAAFVQSFNTGDTVNAAPTKQQNGIRLGNPSRNRHFQHLLADTSRVNHDFRPNFLPIFLASSDAILDANNSGNNNAEEVAQKLRQRAKDLRKEALAEERNLRNIVESKKEADKREADEWIHVLLRGNTPHSMTQNEVVEDLNNVVAFDGTEEANHVHSNIPSAQTLALRMKEYKLTSMSKLIKIVERLHDRETSMLIGPEAMLSKPETISAGASFNNRGFVLGDYENNSMEPKVEENIRISGLLDRLLEAVQLLDEESGEINVASRLAPNLRMRVAELRESRAALLKRRVDAFLQSSKESESAKRGLFGGNGSDLDDLVRSSLQGDSNSDDNNEKRQRQEKMMKRLIETPQWLPTSLAPFAATSPAEVSVSHWKMIKTDLLTDGDIICTSWDSTDVAAVFRVRIARNEVDSEENYLGTNSQIAKIFNDIVVKLEEHPDLEGKVQLFLVDDNEWRPSMADGWNGAEDTTPPPVIIALPKDVEPEQESERGIGTKALAAFSTLTTLVTTLGYALSSFALNPSFFNAVVNENDVSLVPLCLPIFVGVLAISAFHELGHLVAAKKYGVKLGSPVPLPSFQVGSFGCITPMRSFPPTRTAIFDVAICGPGIAMVVSLFMIVAGFNLTTTSVSFSTFPHIPAAVMKSSFLVGSIATLVAPKVMLAPQSQPIPVHPLFMIGLAGLVMSSVNLLPIGRLDGGRACMAAWGRKVASSFSFLSLLAMAFYSFSGFSGVIMFWGALVVMTQRLPDIPAVNEVTGVGGLRSNVYIGLLILAVLTLTPFPGGVNPI